jgi:regulator of protease activity HflC (stomatin/prohibitin superfamily)
MTRINELARRLGVFARAGWAAVTLGLLEIFGSPRGRRLLAVLALAGAAVLIGLRPPLQTVEPGMLGVRLNRLTGGLTVLPEGPALVLPIVNELRRYPVRDQVYRPRASAAAEGAGAFQSVEGLSLGVEVTVRYALDPRKMERMASRLPRNVGADLIEPMVDGVLHRAFARRTVREIFTDKRLEIQQEIEVELRQRLQEDGVVVRALFLGHVDLPARYRQGLEGLLAEELASEKMRYTLELKQKKVQESALEGDAAKVQREKAAEAAGLEEVIAARARAEAMKHVLPLKEKEIEQRRLEAEARKVQRMKDAEGQAEARRIEAQGEAQARRTLSEAEAYRIEVTGKATTAQLAREGELITRNPLLIQKTVADKLSDKIQVVIAPPGAGGFFASGLLGGTGAGTPAVAPRGDRGPMAAESSPEEAGR